MSLVTKLNALEGGCLIVSNIGAPTQEDSLLSLNMSSINTVEGKGHSTQRGLTDLLSHPLDGLSHQIGLLYILV